jgi:hypothetical protein
VDDHALARRRAVCQTTKTEATASACPDLSSSLQTYRQKATDNGHDNVTHWLAWSLA